MGDEGKFGIGSDVWPGLAKTMEEAGELVQVCAKVIAMDGQENYDHWDGNSLIDKMVEELGDLLAAMQFMTLHVPELFDRRDDIRTRRDYKLTRFEYWQRGGTGLPDGQ